MKRRRVGPKTPKKAKKQRRSNITLVTRNGVLVAMTPADRRRQVSLKDALAQPKPRIAQKAPTRSRSKKKNSVQINVDALIEGFPNRTLPELRKIWLNLIRRVGARSPTDAEKRFKSALISEWSKRAEVAVSDPGHFEWPSTDAKGGDGKLVLGDLPGEGMLAFLGYRVGMSQGLTEGSRVQILDVVFDAPLPPINGPDYMRSWGSPASAYRLKKLADALASFTRNAKRRKDPALDSAITDWERDLEYLYYQYYVGKFGFAWPSLDVR